MIEILAKAGHALISVVIVGVVLGAGLPALYGLGMRSLMLGRTVGPDGEPNESARPAGLALALLCFGIVLAAIAYGILIIIFGGKVLPGGGHG